MFCNCVNQNCYRIDLRYLPYPYYFIVYANTIYIAVKIIEFSSSYLPTPSCIGINNIMFQVESELTSSDLATAPPGAPLS